MDSNAGGQPYLSPEERQRQTAAEIARRKVLAAYSRSQLEKSGQFQSQNSQPAASQPTSSYKQAPIQTAISNQDWQKYHNAWQNYYQKYYSEYYAKAARQYLEKEKLKEARAKHDDQILENTHVATTLTEQQSSAIEQTLKTRIQAKASDKFKNSRRHRHLVPIVAGVLVVLLILFLQYNRLIFAPIMAYIAPGNTEDTGITAIDPTTTVAPTADPRLIIPKLNVDVPVAFGISNDDATINEAMNHGVAHFAIPGADAFPGEVGNTVITGHSAGDIYSNNQYKFIFSGLERLTAGDMIYINYNSVRYTYSVTRLETVEPTNVAALVYSTNKPMLTLITCTPLGTSRYRLLVTAEQINPIPDATAETTVVSSNTAEELMPANEPSFFEKIWNWLTGR